jgi:DNA-binding transcriptional LysR family regulator
MNISQSAMSHSLARLRDAFSDPLFIRTAKGLEPTAKALAVSTELDAVLNQIDHLFDRPKFNPEIANAKVCIQTHDFIAATHLANFLANSRKQAPNIIFEIQMISDNSYSLLESGKIDLIIGAGIRANPKFMQRRLSEEKLVCLLDRQHPALADWSEASVFSAPHVKLSVLEERDDPISQHAKHLGLAGRNIGLHTQTLTMQPYVIQGTDLIAFVPESVAKLGAQLFDLTIQSCPFELPNLTVKAIWHERNQHSALHSWIRELLAESFIL